jgi:hypothetical protein
MGFFNWLKKAAGTAVGGFSTFNNSIMRPVSSFLQQVPIVGEVFKAGAPIQDFTFKATDALADYLNDAPRKRSVTMNEFMDAAAAVPKTVMAYKGAKTGIQSKMNEYQREYGPTMVA